MKACPFCGNKDTEAEKCFSPNNKESGYVVRCNECDIEGVMAPSKRRAIVMWNTRLPEQELIMLIEHLLEGHKAWAQEYPCGKDLQEATNLTIKADAIVTAFKKEHMKGK